MKDETLYSNLLNNKEEKKIIAWFKKPIKKVGKLYGVQFVTLRPFPTPSWFEENYKK